MDYVRLTGKKRGLFTQHTLWRGGDHLLSVESNGYAEDYRRFYFKDVQAVIIRTTTRARTVSLTLAVSACFVTLAAFTAAAGNRLFLTYLCGILSAGLLIGFLINVLRGPTCTCRLKMPLVDHELPALCRLKHARAMLAELRPLVQALQGTLSDEEVRTKFSRSAAAGDFRASSTHSRTGRAASAAGGEYAGSIHRLLFGLLLVDAALTLVQYSHSDVPLYFIGMLSGMALFILVIMALVRQKGRSLPQAAKTLTWAAMIFLTANYIFSYCFSIGYFIMSRRPEAFRSRWALFSAMAQVTPSEHPLLADVYIGYMVVSVVLGVCGLLALTNWRRRERGAVASPASPSRMVQEGRGR